jgi:hypothetical protein
MSRALFRTWGASLPQEDFAQAIAAVGVLGVSLAPPDERAVAAAVRKICKNGLDIMPLALKNLAVLVVWVRRHGSKLPDAAAYRSAWTQIRDDWDRGRPRNAPFLRLEIDPAVPTRLRSSAPDLFWLLRLLQGGLHALASSVYVRVDEPDRPIAWEWPLRVGVLGDAHSVELADFVATIPWPQLVKVVHLDAVDEDCDLLLLPDDLRGAAARVLKHPRRLRADCVLLVGGAGVAQERFQPLVAALRGEVLTGGVGLVRVEAEREREWVRRLFEELSHDLPLDVALLRANGDAVPGGDAEPPLLIASRRLVTNARISAFASRYGQQLRRMATARAAPPPATNELEAAGAEFEIRAERGEWLSESGSASDVPRMRKRAEASVGASLPAERDGAPVAQPARRGARRVNFTVTDVTDAAAPARVRDRLAADCAYEMALYIGLPRKDVESFPNGKASAVARRALA